MSNVAPAAILSEASLLVQTAPAQPPLRSVPASTFDHGAGAQIECDCVADALSAERQNTGTGFLKCAAAGDDRGLPAGGRAEGLIGAVVREASAAVIDIEVDCRSAGDRDCVGRAPLSK